MSMQPLEEATGRVGQPCLNMRCSLALEDYHVERKCLCISRVDFKSCQIHLGLGNITVCVLMFPWQRYSDSALYLSIGKIKPCRDDPLHERNVHVSSKFKPSNDEACCYTVDAVLKVLEVFQAKQNMSQP